MLTHNPLKRRQILLIPCPLSFTPPSVYTTTKNVAHAHTQVHLSSTMGKGFLVDVGTVDPSSARFMLVDADAEDLVRKALQAEMSSGPTGGDGSIDSSYVGAGDGGGPRLEENSGAARASL